MPYETIGGLPTHGITYMELLDHLRESQKCCAILSHLHNTEGNVADEALANGWLSIAENLRRMQHMVTKLAQGRMN